MFPYHIGICVRKYIFTGYIPKAGVAYKKNLIFVLFFMTTLKIFSDTDENLNLADVLLDRIKELEPDFEQLISGEN